MRVSEKTLMGRGRTIFPIALAGSLALHAAGTAAYMGYWSLARRSDSPKSLEVAVKFVDPELDDMGDAKGTGIGSNNSPGEHPMQAREADADQALLSRDPVGIGRIGGPPEQYQGPVGEAGGSPPAPPPTPPSPAVRSVVPAPAVAPPPPDVELPKETNATVPAPAVAVSPIVPDFLPPVAQPKPNPPQPTPLNPKAAVAAASSPSQNASHPGIPVSAADPLPPNESDSDPFARIGSAVFHDGKLDVRLGRKVKTVRPQIGIGGYMDAIALNYPSIVLEIHIDPTGRVSQVEFARKSGSVALDEPTRDAVYQWWFEPAHDKSGKPIPDVIMFTIEFR